MFVGGGGRWVVVYFRRVTGVSCNVRRVQFIENRTKHFLLGSERMVFITHFLLFSINLVVVP